MPSPPAMTEEQQLNALKSVELGNALDNTKAQFQPKTYVGVHLVSSDNTAEALFEEAQYEFDAGEYKAAQRNFESVIEKFPTSIFAVKSRKYLAIIRARNPNFSTQLSPRMSRPNSTFLRRKFNEETSAATLMQPNENYRGNSKLKAKPIFVLDPTRQHALLMQSGDRVFFAAQSSEIGAKALIALQRQANWLRNQDGVRIRVMGHAFDGPQNSDDEKLSLQRAVAVQERLISYGVPAETIEVVALGRTQPVAECDTATCRAQNRRVVLQIMSRRMSKNSLGHAVDRT